MFKLTESIIFTRVKIYSSLISNQGCFFGDSITRKLSTATFIKRHEEYIDNMSNDTSIVFGGVTGGEFAGLTADVSYKEETGYKITWGGLPPISLSKFEKIDVEYLNVFRNHLIQFYNDNLERLRKEAITSYKNAMIEQVNVAKALIESLDLK